jgi:hypothetical protein
VAACRIANGGYIMPFVDYTPPAQACRHPEHDPPKMIVLPAGAHTYQCPACGHTTTFHVPLLTC